MSTMTLQADAFYPARVMRLGRAKTGQLRLLANEVYSRGGRVRPVIAPVSGHTASWTPTVVKSRPYHIITLDPEYHLSMNRGQESHRLRLAYGAALLRHERWHGILSDRDFSKVNEALRTHKLSASLWNLAEDLRIEEAARLREGKPFEWTRWHATKAGTDDPVRYLFECLTQERPRPATSWKGPEWHVRVRSGTPDPETRTRDILDTFAAEMRAAATTMDLVPILCDFRDTFPTATTDCLPAKYAGTGYGAGTDASGSVSAGTHYTPEPEPDFPLGLPAAKLADLAEHFAVKAYSATGLSHTVNHIGAARGTAALVKVARDREKVYFGRAQGKTLRQLATPLAGRLARMLGTVDSPRTRTATSGPRLHLSGVMVGDAQAFRQRVVRGGKRKLVVIFDQSGSMQADWYKHGAVFASALQLLRQQGLIDAMLVMTGGRKHAVVPKAMNLTLFAGLHCGHGCESVDTTLDAYKADILAADTTLIYTDGKLTDGKVDAGKWRSHGVDLIGATVAQSYNHATLRRAMTEHFSRAILATNGEELATAIMQYILAR